MDVNKQYVNKMHIIIMLAVNRKPSGIYKTQIALYMPWQNKQIKLYKI